MNWVKAKEARRNSGVAHEVGHKRLGDKHTKCGKRVGDAIPKKEEYRFRLCKTCRAEVNDEVNKANAEITTTQADRDLEDRKLAEEEAEGYSVESLGKEPGALLCIAAELALIRAELIRQRPEDL